MQVDSKDIGDHAEVAYACYVMYGLKHLSIR